MLGINGDLEPFILAVILGPPLVGWLIYGVIGIIIFAINPIGLWLQISSLVALSLFALLLISILISSLFV